MEPPRSPRRQHCNTNENDGIFSKIVAPTSADVEEPPSASTASSASIPNKKRIKRIKRKVSDLMFHDEDVAVSAGIDDLNDMDDMNDLNDMNDMRNDEFVDNEDGIGAGLAHNHENETISIKLDSVRHGDLWEKLIRISTTHLIEDATLLQFYRRVCGGYYGCNRYRRCNVCNVCNVCHSQRERNAQNFHGVGGRDRVPHCGLHGLHGQHGQHEHDEDENLKFDCSCDIYNLEKDDGGVVMIKLVKFLVFCVLWILIIYYLSRFMNWEHDPNYSIKDFYLFDLPTVLLDLVFFFFIGRLFNNVGVTLHHRRYQDQTVRYQQSATSEGIIKSNASKYISNSIDVLFPWQISLFLGSIYPSVISNFEFLRHSLSMYEIMCNWPPILFVYVFVIIALVLGLLALHLQSHHRRGVLSSRIVELAILFIIFLLPYFIFNESFHLHHWYGMWLIGMNANAPEWWSRCVMAFCLGSYINGIAVWGRDPILGCNYAFYRSTNAECLFMECYEEAGTDEGDGTEDYKPFVTPDWRLCNAESLGVEGLE